MVIWQLLFELLQLLNAFIPNGAIYGQEEYSDLGPDGPFYEDFEWFLDDYVVSYSSCNNGNPDDQVLNTNDNAFPTQEYTANTDCD